MSTKDPHVAMIDAQEQLEFIKAQVRAAIDLLKAKAIRGELTKDDKLMIAAIRAEAIDRTKRVQEKLYEELESHGKLN